MSVVQWASGKLLVWDATSSDTFAMSNISVAITKAGVVAEKPEQLNMSKCAHLDTAYRFVPVAVETSGVLGPQSLHFAKDLGRHLQSAIEEPKLSQYPIHKLSVAAQRGNAATVLDTIGQQDGLDF